MISSLSRRVSLKVSELREIWARRMIWYRMCLYRRMTVSASVFVRVLEEEIKLWAEAAMSCDSAVSLLSGERQKMKWILIAASYRHRAKDLEAMIDEVRRTEGNC